MPDLGRGLSALTWAAIFTSGMAVLVAGIALALGTTGHDWHAAWKMTLTEAMLGVGFDLWAPVEYRTADGETVTVTRYRLARLTSEPWHARRKLLSMAADRAVLGACTGLALLAIWAAMLAAPRLRRPSGRHRTVVEPSPRFRRERTGRMRHPDGWKDGELIAALARRSGRLGILLVSTEEIGRLSGNGGGGAGHAATPQDSLPSARTPGLPWPEHAEPAPKAPAPGNPAQAKPGSRPDADEPEGADGDGAIARKREPGEEFF